MPKLLVVDDEALLRETLRTTLSRVGYTVITAADGREAMAKLDAEDVSVVLLDILMPGQEGIETILALRRRPDPPVIIAMSGGGTQMYLDVLSAAAKLGADFTIAKPFTPKQLISLLERSLSAQSSSFEGRGTGARSSCRLLSPGGLRGPC